MTPPSQNVPGYSEDLESGHSHDCRELGITHYLDLHEDIKDTADQVRDGLYDFISTDLDFADDVDRILGRLGLNRQDYQGLLVTLSYIQMLLEKSKLSEEERKAFWMPIAQCYVRVQAVLKERIVALEQRELIGVGTKLRIPVQVMRGARTGDLLLIAELPEFQYALQHISRDNPSHPPHTYRVPITHIEFKRDYMHGLLPEIKARLEAGTTMELPIKVVSVYPNMPTYAEIDAEAFLGQ
ncbi:MAG: hypothetical protein WC777_05630 [Candidatus Gracilibacteria bacterium]